MVSSGLWPPPTTGHLDQARVLHGIPEALPAVFLGEADLYTLLRAQKGISVSGAVALRAQAPRPQGRRECKVSGLSVPIVQKKTNYG